MYIKIILSGAEIFQVRKYFTDRVPVNWQNRSEKNFRAWKNFRTWKKRDATTDSGSEIKFGAKMQKRIHSIQMMEYF